MEKGTITYHRQQVRNAGTDVVDALNRLLLACERPDEMSLDEIEHARTHYVRAKDKFYDCFMDVAKCLGGRCRALEA